MVHMIPEPFNEASLSPVVQDAHSFYRDSRMNQLSISREVSEYSIGYTRSSLDDLEPPLPMAHSPYSFGGPEPITWDSYRNSRSPKQLPQPLRRPQSHSKKDNQGPSYTITIMPTDLSSSPQIVLRTSEEILAPCPVPGLRKDFPLPYQLPTVHEPPIIVLSRRQVLPLLTPPLLQPSVLDQAQTPTVTTATPTADVSFPIQKGQFSRYSENTNDMVTLNGPSTSVKDGSPSVLQCANRTTSHPPAPAALKLDPFDFSVNCVSDCPNDGCVINDDDVLFNTFMYGNPSFQCSHPQPWRKLRAKHHHYMFRCHHCPARWCIPSSFFYASYRAGLPVNDGSSP